MASLVRPAMPRVCVRTSTVNVLCADTVIARTASAAWSAASCDIRPAASRLPPPAAFAQMFSSSSCTLWALSHAERAANDTKMWDKQRTQQAYARRGCCTRRLGRARPQFPRARHSCASTSVDCAQATQVRVPLLWLTLLSCSFDTSV